MTDYSIKVKLTDINKESLEFSTLNHLSGFLNKESEFWSSVHNSLVENGNKSHAYVSRGSQLSKAYEMIKSWSLEDLEGEENLRLRMSDLFNQHLQGLESRWLWSGSSLAEEYIKILEENEPEVAIHFVDYVTKNQIPNNITQPHAFLGCMYGYEFKNKNSDILKRRNTEKRSLNRIRKQYQENQDELFQKTKDFEKEHTDWTQKAKKYTEKQSRVYKALAEKRAKQIEKLVEEKQTHWMRTMEALEATYSKKLKLEAPARYWERRARNLGFQGLLSLTFLVLVLTLATIGGGTLFYAWLQGDPIPFSLSSLQGVALFGATLTAFAYLVKTLSRITFSAFHLQRDAEEREQLAYFYLSLIKDAKLDKPSDEIVFQALFSRSESGLLGGDNSTPKMPSSGDVLAALSRMRP